MSVLQPLVFTALGGMLTDDGGYQPCHKARHSNSRKMHLGEADAKRAQEVP